MDLYLGKTYYGYGYLLDNFVVPDVDDRSYVHYMDCCFPSNSSVLNVNDDVNVNIWHVRLGHIGQDKMNRLAKKCLLRSLNKIELPTCEHCLKGKITKKPFGKGIKVDNPLQLIHFDICGSMNVRARYGAIYFITFINDNMHYGHVFLIT